PRGTAAAPGSSPGATLPRGGHVMKRAWLRLHGKAGWQVITEGADGRLGARTFGHSTDGRRRALRLLAWLKARAAGELPEPGRGVQGRGGGAARRSPPPPAPPPPLGPCINPATRVQNRQGP